MKPSIRVKVPKFLTEPIRLSHVAAAWSFLLRILTRPISLRVLWLIPAVLWLIWPKLEPFIVHKIAAINHFPGFVLNFIVDMISAASILALVAPLVKAGKVTVELGLFPPANREIGSDEGSAADPSIGQERSDETPPRSSHAFEEAVSALGALVLTTMILWLAGKDWFLSSAVAYPYISSISASLSIGIACLAAFTIARAGVWRIFMLGLSTLLCAVYLRLSPSSAAFWGIMPTTGVLLCALVFPWHAGAASFQGSRLLSPGLWRRCFAGATFIGFAAFVLWTDSDLPAAFLAVTAIIAGGFLLRSVVRSAANSTAARVVLVSFYAACVASYWILSLGPIFNGSRWSLLGNGLHAYRAQEFHYGFDSLGEAGLVSVAVRGLILTWVLTGNARALLCWTSKLNKAMSAHTIRESIAAMELSIGAIICVFSQVLFFPIFRPLTWLDPISVPSWTLALSLASLVIATRAMRNVAEDKVPETYLRKDLVVVRARLWAGATLLVLIACVMCGLARTIGKERVLEDSLHSMPLAAICPAFLREAQLQLPTSQTRNSTDDLIRRACGSPVKIVPSLYNSVAILATSGDHEPAILRALDASFLSLVFERTIAPTKALELYLNGRDYGAPSPGLTAASNYFFQKSPGSLTAAGADFLLSDGSPLGAFRCRSTRATPRFAPSNSVFSYALLPTPPGVIMHAAGMNNRGEIVGSTLDSLARFLWSHGRITTLANGSPEPVAINNSGQFVGGGMMWDTTGRTHELYPPSGYVGTDARGINDKGQVVGYMTDESASHEPHGVGWTLPTHAFLWDNGKMMALGQPSGYSASRAYSINASGQVAGWLLTNDGQTHAAVWENGEAHDLGAFGTGTLSVATCINDAGQVVGAAEHSNGNITAFLWQNGVMHDLGKLYGDEKSRAYSINNLGQIVGASYSGDINDPGHSRAFLWDGAHGMRDLTSLLAADSGPRPGPDGRMSAYSINDNGQIMGVYHPDWHRSMFLLSPRNLKKNE